MHAEPKTKRIRVLLFTMMSAMGLLLAACTVLSGGSRVEPPYVVVSNNTSQNLQNVELKESPRADHQPSRLASVSPLMAGRTYAVRRRPDAQPLNDNILVSWEWGGGRKRTAEVSIANVIKKSTGISTEALIFHLMPDGGVRVTVDELPDG